MSSCTKPLLLTMGEPAGIGPDLALLARARAGQRDVAPFAVVGCLATLKARAEALAVDFNLAATATAAEAAQAWRQGLGVIDRPVKTVCRPGQVNPDEAGTVQGWIALATRQVLDGSFAGLVTGPIQKETLYRTGFPHQGHTDFLADLARAAGHAATPVMMLSCPALRTIPVTVHVPLSQVSDQLTTDAIIAQGRVADRALRTYFGLDRPRLAVSGLNPHAGENGTIGTEDKTVIAPAVRQLQAEGISATGPHPADTLFHEQVRASYDVALCMYHDQALIPVKTLGFHEGVNTTLGLPFVRTSPDHGTALDIAGTGAVNPASTIAALNQARDMVAACAAGQTADEAAQ